MKIPVLIERLMSMLGVYFLRTATRTLLEGVSNGIAIRSTEIISDYMAQLGISDMDTSLDFVVDFDTDTDTILENIVARLQRTIPYIRRSLRVIPKLNTNPDAKRELAKIWYKRFVSKKLTDNYFRYKT